MEIEFAVRDLLKTISSYKLESHVEEVNEDDMAKLKKVAQSTFVSAYVVCNMRELCAAYFILSITTH